MRNNGDGTFEDVAGETGVEFPRASSGAMADVNRDGYPEIVLSSAALLINNGDGTFTDQSDFAGFDFESELTVFTDLDADGWIDFYGSLLYQNGGYPVDVGRNWITVELEGIRSPRDGTGALVEVVTDGLHQAKIYGEASGKSMGSLPVEFGLDTSPVVDSLVVHWTSGIVQALSGMAANQVIHVIEDTTLTGIGSGSGGTEISLPRAFALSQNYPNPFNPSTTIRYDIPVANGSDDPGRRGPEAVPEEEGVPVRLFIYDIRGRLVRRLVNEEKDPGRYQVHWDGRDDRGASVSSGVYLYRLQAGDFVSTKKMVMVR